MNLKDRTQLFLSRAAAVHGDLFDYSLVNYKNAHIKVTIICRIHGSFEQSPNSHIQGIGCPLCAVPTRQNTMKERYGHSHALQNKNSLDKMKQTMIDRYGVDHPMKSAELLDKCHATSLERFGNIHHIGSQIVREKSKNTMLERYGVEYTLQSPVLKEKGIQTMINRYGTSNIAEIPEFVNKRKQTLNDRYGVDYTFQSDVIKQKTKQTLNDRYGVQNYSQFHMKDAVQLLLDREWLHKQYELKTECDIANELGIHQTTVGVYRNNHNIPINNPSLYSKTAVNWLNYIMEHDNIFIQHVLNGGEYQIPGTRYKVDGYCADNNTIYEFYGDYWHGNPNIFESTFMNNTIHKSMGELYENTMIREQVILELGYNLVTCWEADWVFLQTIQGGEIDVYN